MLNFFRRNKQDVKRVDAFALGQSVGTQIAAELRPFLDTSFAELEPAYLDIAKQRAIAAFELKDTDVSTHDVLIIMAQEFYAACDSLPQLILDKSKIDAHTAYELADIGQLGPFVEEQVLAQAHQWIAGLKDKGLEAIIIEAWPHLSDSEREMMTERGRQLDT